MKAFLFAAAPVTEPGSKKPRGQRWKDPPGEEPVRKKRGRPMTKNLDLDPDPDPGEGRPCLGGGRECRLQHSKGKAEPVGVGLRTLDVGLRGARQPS